MWSSVFFHVDKQSQLSDSMSTASVPSFKSQLISIPQERHCFARIGTHQFFGGGIAMKDMCNQLSCVCLNFVCKPKFTCHIQCRNRELVCGYGVHQSAGKIHWMSRYFELQQPLPKFCRGNITRVNGARIRVLRNPLNTCNR